MTVTLERAQAELVELLAGMAPGEELVIERDNVRVAKLIAEPKVVRKHRVAGRGKAGARMKQSERILMSESIEWSSCDIAEFEGD